ncbi:MAG: cytochrome b/b6 domain-containing protein [Gammaproteobacteria bacterium]
MSANTQQKIKIWDPLVRLFHWGLVISFFTAYITEDRFLDIHVLVGYTALALLSIRLIWGIIGSYHARFVNFVRSPSVIAAYLKDILMFRARHYLGHNPAGGAMVIALMISVTVTCVSGLFVLGALEYAGPLASLFPVITDGYAHALEDIHEFSANFTLFLVALHLGGILLASIQHKEDLVRSMFTGYKMLNSHPILNKKGVSHEKFKSRHADMLDARG